MDREQNRTRRDGLLYLCYVPLLAYIYMVYTWAVAIQYMSFVRAVCDVRTYHFKVQNMLTVSETVAE